MCVTKIWRNYTIYILLDLVTPLLTCEVKVTQSCPQAIREAQEYWSGWPIPSPGDLPDPGIEPGSPALQMDSLPTEQSGKLK